MKTPKNFEYKITKNSPLCFLLLMFELQKYKLKKKAQTRMRNKYVTKLRDKSRKKWGKYIMMY